MTRTLTALLIALLFAAATHAEDPAKLAPANAGVFIELHDLDQLRAHWADDPLIDKVKDKLPQRANPEAWRFIQIALGMTSEQIIDTYFSNQIVVVAERPGDGEPGVIFTRINPADAKKLIDGLLLSKTATINGYDVYEPEDRGSRIAFGGEWMAFADQWSEPWLLDVLNAMGGDKQLADDTAFGQWMSRIPAERQGTAFVRNEEGTHAVGLISRDAGFTLQYAGESPRFATMLGRLGDAKTLDLGPSPDDAMLVVAMNFNNPEPKHAAFIERLIAPHTFEGDFRPAVGSPLVLWLAHREIEGEPVPMLGVALHVSQDAGAEMLDLALNRALVLANFATMQWELPPLVAEKREKEGRGYHLVQLGAALGKRSRLAAIRRAELTFGQAGDWYIVTTSEQSFLDATSVVTEKPEPSTESRIPVARVELQGRRLAEQMNELADRLPPRVQRREGVSRLLATAPWLHRYETITLSLDADDAGVVYATLNGTR